jgi:hypothetical protein
MRDQLTQIRRIKHRLITLYIQIYISGDLLGNLGYAISPRKAEFGRTDNLRSMLVAHGLDTRVISRNVHIT